MKKTALGEGDETGGNIQFACSSCETKTKISLIIRSSTYLVETGESRVCLLTIAESSPSPSVCAGERWAGGGVRADPTWYYTILVSTDQTITL